MTKSGMNVMRNNTTSNGIINGIIARDSLSNETSEILVITYRHIPTGGVIRPIMTFRMKNTPKWTGSMCNALISGISTGTMIMMIELLSSRQPMINRTALMNISSNVLLSLTDNKFLILLMINVFLLAVGMFVDNIPATIILSPIFLPVVAALGIGPTQLGLIITMNLAIGFVTPPYGINLFVASAVAGVPIERMFKPSMWLIVALLIVLMLVTYVPSVTMGLVDFVHSLKAGG